ERGARYREPPATDPRRRARPRHRRGNRRRAARRLRRAPRPAEPVKAAPEGLRFTTTGEDADTTLAAALRRRLGPGTSWNDVRELVRSGKVTIDAARELDPARRLQSGLEVALDPRARRAEKPGGPPPVHIVFEDTDVVVIDKPSGISSVPYEKRET